MSAVWRSLPRCEQPLLQRLILTVLLFLQEIHGVDKTVKSGGQLSTSQQQILESESGVLGCLLLRPATAAEVGGTR